MTIETRTVIKPVTGWVGGSWQEHFGSQKVNIKVNPKANSSSQEFQVTLERRWGPLGSDLRTEDFWLPREGAKVLRDALDAALEWSE